MRSIRALAVVVVLCACTPYAGDGGRPAAEAGPAGSAPVESGGDDGGRLATVDGGGAGSGVLVVNGSGFGTKPVAAPLKYDDFQSVAPGAAITTSVAPGPAWSANGSAPETFVPIASAAKLRPGTSFTRNMQSHFVKDTQGASNVALVGQTFVKAYIDAWMVLDTTGVTGGSPQNIKPFRLHSAGASAPSANIASALGCAADVGTLVAGQRDGVTRSDSDWYDTASADVWCNRWAHIQWMIDAGSGNGAADGSIVSYVNGRLDYDHRSVPTTGSGQRSWPEWYVGNYIRNDDEWSGAIYAYWESVYIDTSWARVEIGDSPTYAGSQHREIQIPTAWSDTQVSFRLNRGSFAPGTHAYVFVVNADNVPSVGAPITIE